MATYCPLALPHRQTRWPLYRYHSMVAGRSRRMIVVHALLLYDWQHSVPTLALRWSLIQSGTKLSQSSQEAAVFAAFAAVAYSRTTLCLMPWSLSVIISIMVRRVETRASYPSVPKLAIRFGQWYSVITAWPLCSHSSLVSDCNISVHNSVHAEGRLILAL